MLPRGGGCGQREEMNSIEETGAGAHVITRQNKHTVTNTDTDTHLRKAVLGAESDGRLTHARCNRENVLVT